MVEERVVKNNDRPVRLSPLHRRHRELEARFVTRGGWQIPEAYTSPAEEVLAVQTRVGVSDVSAAGKLVVRGDAAGELLMEAFDVELGAPGVVSPAVLKDEPGFPLGAGRVARLTPDEFLLLTVPGAEVGAGRRLEQRRVARELFVTMVNQTSGLAGLLVAGPDSRALLRKLCALPFGPATFPNYHVAQGSLAKVHAIVARNDLDEVPAFELYCDRSYGEYVWDAIIDAGREFGVVPFGRKAKDLLAKNRKL